LLPDAPDLRPILRKLLYVCTGPDAEEADRAMVADVMSVPEYAAQRRDGRTRAVVPGFVTLLSVVRSNSIALPGPDDLPHSAPAT